MRNLVETLESTSDKTTHTTCGKQCRLFRALYDVAVKYVEIKTRRGDNYMGISWTKAQQQYYTTFPNGPGPSSTGSVGNVTDANTIIELGGSTDLPTLRDDVDREGTAFGASYFATAGFGGADMDMGMDASGAQLWDWFNKNQSFMRMFEDA